MSVVNLLVALLECKGSILIVACLFALAHLVEAGPPFVTDDPEPTRAGGWEINVPFIIEHTAGETEMDAPLFDVNYGLPNVQLKFEAPVQIALQKTTRTAGLGDPIAGIKWRFFADEESQLQLGVYPQLLLPIGNPRRGLGQGRPAYILPFLAQKSWAKWTVYGNVGYWWQTANDRRNYWYSGAVLEREVNDRLTIGAELFGNTPQERDGRAEVAFNIGAIWKLKEHINVLSALGRDFVGGTHLIAYVGLQFLTK
jgi:hypothetical protein